MTLSEREMELLNHLYGPNTIKVVASEMGVTFHTAKSMTKIVYRKLDVDSRTALMADRIRTLETKGKANAT